MAFTITNQTSTIKFLFPTGVEYHIDKDNMSIKKRGRYVYVYHQDDNVKLKKLKIRYTEITSPVFASNDELVTALIGYKSQTDVTIGDVVITDGVDTLDIKSDGTIDVNLKGSISDTESANVRIDPSTHSMQTIDYAHHEIHSGSHFKAGYQNIALDNNDTLDLLFVTPNTTKWAHFVMTAKATAKCSVAIYEGTTTSADGTAVTIWNRNRNSIKTPTVVVTHTPTVTSVGTKMAEHWMGTDGKDPQGGDARGDSEFMLKQNTKYLVRLTAEDNAMKGAIGGDWYEHEDKD